MNTRIEMREYQPGEICEFTMNVLTTREKPGSHEYELRIDYEDPRPARRRLSSSSPCVARWRSGHPN